MANIDLTGTGPLLGAIPADGQHKSFVLSNVIDLTGVIPVANDIYQCLPVPAGTLVRAVKIKWITPMVGTSGTIDVGDGAGVDSWDAAVDCKTSAGTFTHSIVGTDAFAVAASDGKFYASADSIDVKIKAIHADATAGAKFKIMAFCVDCN